MQTVLTSILIVVAAANLILLAALWLRSGSNRTFAKDVREDLRAGREELRASNHQANETVAGGIRTFTEMGVTLGSRVKELQDGSEAKLEATRAVLERIRETVDTRLEHLRQNLDVRVQEMQNGNERKLEEMRRTVDEKLQGTLEKRLGESFKFVSDRLEMVHKGLGEMAGLASGVGDLKRIFSNVKVRGTFAEVQLGGILDQMLNADQWSKNVCVKEGTLERVEYAIRLPGPKDDAGCCMWLPIDSKFPTEDYARLQSAAEAGDAGAVQAATEALLRTLRAAAKDIHDKYVNPPATTDYAIMFLATEGLYAEALRQPQFVEEMLLKYRTMIAGPTTLSAIVSSLRMGFQTLVVEQRASEVWRVLGAVKTEFGKFGGVLDKVHRQLSTATRTIEETGTRTRAMERRLRAVEQMEPGDSAAILALPVAALLDGGDGVDPDADADTDVDADSDGDAAAARFTGAA